MLSADLQALKNELLDKKRTSQLFIENIYDNYVDEMIYEKKQNPMEYEDWIQCSPIALGETMKMNMIDQQIRSFDPSYMIYDGEMRIMSQPNKTLSERMAEELAIKYEREKDEYRKVTGQEPPPNYTPNIPLDMIGKSDHPLLQRHLQQQTPVNNMNIYHHLGYTPDGQPMIIYNDINDNNLIPDSVKLSNMMSNQLPNYIPNGVNNNMGGNMFLTNGDYVNQNVYRPNSVFSAIGSNTMNGNVAYNPINTNGLYNNNTQNNTNMYMNPMAQSIANQVSQGNTYNNQVSFLNNVYNNYGNSYNQLPFNTAGYYISPTLGMGQYQNQFNAFNSGNQFVSPFGYNQVYSVNPFEAPPVPNFINSSSLYNPEYRYQDESSPFIIENGVLFKKGQYAYKPDPNKDTSKMVIEYEEDEEYRYYLNNLSLDGRPVLRSPIMNQYGMPIIDSNPEQQAGAILSAVYQQPEVYDENTNTLYQYKPAYMPFGTIGVGFDTFKDLNEIDREIDEKIFHARMGYNPGYNPQLMDEINKLEGERIHRKTIYIRKLKNDSIKLSKSITKIANARYSEDDPNYLTDQQIDEMYADMYLNEYQMPNFNKRRMSTFDYTSPMQISYDLYMSQTYPELYNPMVVNMNNHHAMVTAEHNACFPKDYTKEEYSQNSWRLIEMYDKQREEINMHAKVINIREHMNPELYFKLMQEMNPELSDREIEMKVFIIDNIYHVIDAYNSGGTFLPSDTLIINPDALNEFMNTASVTSKMCWRAISRNIIPRTDKMAPTIYTSVLKLEDVDDIKLFISAANDTLYNIKDLVNYAAEFKENATGIQNWR